MADKSMIVTAALPYANGEIHLGHLVEYSQADFWTRFHKMKGRDCHYFCADDTHGTPIMVSARQQGITPEELIAGARERHLRDLNGFQVHFDNFSSTNSQTNKEMCSEIFLKMQENAHITTRSINQAYCEHDKMFLPDRFVRGECPKCGTEDQYGDSCDSCGATYAPTDLKSPACSICGNAPVEKASEHVFFKLNDFKEYLRSWLLENCTKEVSNKMLEWFEEDLREWDISRDAPYFGFEIPGFKDKYFYVWVDAPVGYMASAKEWCDANGRDFSKYWDDSEIYHFIGKDIVYFHTLFWPAMLKAANKTTPSGVFVHGMLTVNGVKMSKSKGTFINAKTYLEHLDPMYLRYYYACKFNSSMEDVDLNLEDFVSRVNSDLVGKITNLASRGAQMLNKRLGGELCAPDADGLKVIQMAMEKSEEIAALYASRDFSKALRLIREIGDEANRYFDEKAPWKLIKEDEEETRKILSSTLNLFRILAVYLKPILPEYAKKVEVMFSNLKVIELDDLEKLTDLESHVQAKVSDAKDHAGHSELFWKHSLSLIVSGKLNDYEHLATRIDPKTIDLILEASKKDLKAKEAKTKKKDEKKGNSLMSEITIDDFMKVDLRIAKIVDAGPVEGADKLIRLQLDIGEHGTRQVFAGIKAAYDPKDLIGRHTVMVANLKPRKMKFGTSEGMVLAAGAGGSDLFILSPDDGAKAGDRAK